MSNIKFLLQDNLKSIDTKLYQEAKYQEIIFLVKAIQSGIIDVDNYETYFNRKCLIEHKDQLISEISKEIEPSLMNKKKNKRNIIKIFKVLFLFRMKLESGNLQKYLSNFIESQELLENYKPYTSLKKKIDINIEIKNKEEVARLQKERDVLKKNIIKISVDTIKEINEINNLDYDYIIKHINDGDLTILKNIIFNIINNHNDKLSYNISDISYLDLLIKTLTSNKVNSFYDFINNDDITDKYSLSDEISFFILQYKYLLKSDFKYLINLLINMDEEDLLTTKTLNNISTELFDEVKLDRKIVFLIYIFLNILQNCEIPHNEIYLEYLKKLYLKQGIEKQYDNIVKQGKTYTELLDSSKNLFSITVIALKNKKNLINILNNVLQSHINKDLTNQEYDDLISDISVLNQIIRNKEDSYELLSQHINRKLAESINNLINFDLVLNENQTISDLTRNLQNFNYQDIYIQQQLELYKLDTEGLKKADNIYIQAPRIMKNNEIFSILLKYKEWVEKADKINRHLKLDLKSDVEDIFQNILAKTFQHYFRSLQLFLDKELNGNYRNLFYFYEDNKQIKVYTENSIEELLLYVKNELLKQKNIRGIKQDKQILSFIAHKIHYFIFNHTFYSKLHDSEIVLYDILKYDQVVLVSLGKILLQVNDLLKDNKLKKLNTKVIEKDMKELVTQNTENLITENMEKKKYQLIKKVNDKLKILSEKEMRFLALYFKRKTFEFIHKTIQSGQGIKIDESGLNFIKMLINIIKEEIRVKHSFNPLKKNISKIEHIRIKEVEKHIYKLIKGEIKIPKLEKVEIPDVVFFHNPEQVYEVSSSKLFEKNDVSFIELQTLKKYFSDDEQQKLEYKNMISTLVKINFQLLNSIFKINLDKSHIKTLINILQTNDLKVKGISRKLLHKIKLNEITKTSTNTSSIINDIIKELCILYFVDKIITSQKDIEKYFKTENLMMIEEQVAKTIVNKNILVKSNGKMGKVIEKVNKDTFKVKFGKNVKQMKRNQFIIIDSLKHKMVKVIKGNFKGHYGYIQDFKTHKYLSKKERQSIQKHITFIKNLMDKNMSLINVIRIALHSDKLLNKNEFKILKSHRKKEIKRLDLDIKSKPTKQKFEKVPIWYKERREPSWVEMSYVGDDFDWDFWKAELKKLGKLRKDIKPSITFFDKTDSVWVDYKDSHKKLSKKESILANLKANLNVKKVLNYSERYLLEGKRLERIQALQFSINNLKLELATFKKDQTKKNYVVKIRPGTLGARNLFLKRDEIKLDISEIEKEEKINEIVKERQKFSFNNLYQMIQYLFNNLGAYLTPDIDISKTQYYHVVYKNTIKLLNDQKQIDINKLISIKYLKNKLKGLKHLDEKIKLRLKDKPNKKLLVKLSNNNVKIFIIKEKIKESEKNAKSLKVSELLLKSINKVEKYNNDLKIEKMDNEKYILLIENKIEITKQVVKSRKLAAKQKQEKKVDNTKIVNKLINEGVKKYNFFMNSLNLNLESCNILNKLTSMEDYGMEDYIEETGEELTIEELDDLMAGLDEFDELPESDSEIEEIFD